MRKVVTVACVMLAACGQAAADDPTNNVESVHRANPNYSQQDGDTYMYVAAQSPADEGKPPPVVNIRFLGQDGASYRLEQVDDLGKRLALYECSSPCRVMKQTLSYGGFSKQAVTDGSIIDNAFEDAFNGLLMPTASTASTTSTAPQATSLAPTEVLNREVRPVGASTTDAQPIVAPLITGNWRNYRTRISEGWWNGPTLAHRYVIIRFGCGTGCTFNVVGDHRTGRLYDLGLGGEAYQMLDLRFGNDSSVIKARWQDTESDACVTQTFVWTGTNLSASGDSQTTPRDDCPSLT